MASLRFSSAHFRGGKQARVRGPIRRPGGSIGRERVNTLGYAGPVRGPFGKRSSVGRFPNAVNALGRFAAAMLAAVAALVFVTGPAPAASPAPAGALRGRVIDAATDAPIDGARVSATSGQQTASTTTDAAGAFSLPSLALGEYTLTVNSSGYAQRVLHVTVLADQTPALRIAIGRATSAALPDGWESGGPPDAVPHGHRHAHRPHDGSRPQPRAQPPSTAVVPPPPPPAARLAPPGPVVHDSLLGLFNAAHPAHVTNEPYYGRYSYVLLRDGDDAAKAKNLAFVTKLVDRFAASGTSITFDNAAHADNPLAYNIFFFPVRNEISSIKVSAHAGAAQEVLDGYDFERARALRDVYCQARGHGIRSLCTIPYDAGPILVTFLEPLPADLTGAHMPPAFAYDFSRIAIDQCDAPLATVERKIAVPDDVSADSVLPPPLAAHVANELDLLATAINGAFKGVTVWIDKQPGATHGK